MIRHRLQSRKTHPQAGRSDELFDLGGQIGESLRHPGFPALQHVNDRCSEKPLLRAEMLIESGN